MRGNAADRIRGAFGRTRGQSQEPPYLRSNVKRKDNSCKFLDVGHPGPRTHRIDRRYSRDSDTETEPASIRSTSGTERFAYRDHPRSTNGNTSSPTRSHYLGRDSRWRGFRSASTPKHGTQRHHFHRACELGGPGYFARRYVRIAKRRRDSVSGDQGKYS